MALPALTSARWLLLGHSGEERRAGEGGYPTLRLEFADGRVAWVSAEQKPLFYNYPAAVLGEGFEDERWVMPGDPAPGHLFNCTTTDPQIVRLVRDFWRVAVNGSITPQTIDIEQPE